MKKAKKNLVYQTSLENLVYQMSLEKPSLSKRIRKLTFGTKTRHIVTVLQRIIQRQTTVYPAWCDSELLRAYVQVTPIADNAATL